MVGRETATTATGEHPEQKPKKTRKRKAVVKPKEAIPQVQPKLGRRVAAFLMALLRRFPWRMTGLIGTEILAFAGVGLILIIAVLGRAADWFGGTGLAENLLPFAGMVLLLVLLGSGLLWAWWRARGWLWRLSRYLPAALALGLALGAGFLAGREPFRRELAHLRALVGGSEEAERVTIAHQVFAAYRRSDLAQTRRILDRAQPYLPAIRAAALANEIDGEILLGIGAAESSFLPRDSKDGGRGLFQITAPPKAAIDAARRQLGTDKPDPLNPTHNAHLAAATLRHYLREMGGDLFLALLAYNIGPKNGGLRSIMNQYGARDFVTIQPYLQNLPRDYPVRVLSAALAYRLWRTDGRLPRYEEGNNAQHIQDVGIPGLGDGGVWGHRKAGTPPA
ncbi:lytic transglycosylase domain-containing protein [Methylomagnum ishizawai]|uniref:lytic transglycosylase domain-containing protein n=1 Tax=Methylomagnum ishizawai TaxID=1760988 RepID=UPI001C33E0E0|nr:transglycosylase SLT domain-containing protein [Methylomagnum ishizawai]BBL75360.1 hypothetical protein MishRS11D_24580 [Methylomagnum ishizawai]